MVYHYGFNLTSFSMSEVNNFFKNHLYFLFYDFLTHLWDLFYIMIALSVTWFANIISQFITFSNFVYNVLLGKIFWYSCTQSCGYFLLWLLEFAHTQRDVPPCDIVTLKSCLIIFSWKICMHVSIWKVVFFPKFPFLYWETILKIKSKPSLLMW